MTLAVDMPSLIMKFPFGIHEMVKSKILLRSFKTFPLIQTAQNQIRHCIVKVLNCWFKVQFRSTFVESWKKFLLCQTKYFPSFIMVALKLQHFEPRKISGFNFVCFCCSKANTLRTQKKSVIKILKK